MDSNCQHQGSVREPPVAVRKRTFTWQLVAMVEVLDLPKVGRIRPGVPIFKPKLVWIFEFGMFLYTQT